MDPGSASEQMFAINTIIGSICLQDVSRCAETLQLVLRRYPELQGDVVWGVSRNGDREPLGNSLTAARIATVLMGKVIPVIERSSP